MSFMNDGSNAKGKFKERKEKVYHKGLKRRPKKKELKNVVVKKKIDSSYELMRGVGKTKMERMSVVELRLMCLRMKVNVKGECRSILNR